MNATVNSPIKIQEVYPYLRVGGAARAIDFYARAFGAKELLRLTDPSGRIGHAEIKIGDSTLMLSDEYPELGIRGPLALGGTTCAIHLHVDGVDALMKQAIEAGATTVREAADQFSGERSGRVRDPFGHEWLLGQQIENVAAEEIQKRFTAVFA